MVKDNMENWIYPIKERFKLSENFIKEYEGKEPEWGPLGKLTYKRTYAARVEGEDRTEEWWETVRRVVEACYTIQLNHCKNLRLPWNAHKAQKSGQEMYTRMFEFKFIPPGRGLANMGDLVFKRGSMCLFNCSAISTKNIDRCFSDPFIFMCSVSMQGVGCGFDTEGAGKVTIQEPKISDEIFIVEDSREGWEDVIKTTLESFVGKANLPKEIDYSQIRPFGSIIKTSGGFAPGPQPLIDCINDIKKLLYKKVGKKITSGDIVDLMNLIGKCVVSGGKRRCLPEYTEVHTKDGLIQIKDVKVGQEVLTMTGWKKVVDHVYQGKQPIVNIKTQLGDFKCTPQHRMKVYSSDKSGFEFKEAKNINTNDKLVFYFDNEQQMGLSCTDYKFYENILNSSRFLSKLSVGSFVTKLHHFKNIINITEYNRFNNKFDSMSCQNILASIGIMSTLEELSDDDGYILKYDEEQLKSLYEKFKDGSYDDMKNCYPIDVYGVVDLNIEEETYDISVEDNHEFVCGPGLVSHNTAQIAFGYPDDEEYMSLKDPDLYSEEMMHHRWCSNNSIYGYKGMDYTKIINTIKKSGEPGIVYLEKIKNYGRTKDNYQEGIDSEATIMNPCGEISLSGGNGAGGELCNIADVFYARHDSLDDIKRSIKFAYLYCKTVTLVPTTNEFTNSIILKNRRIGVSQSGIIQAIKKFGTSKYFEFCDKGYEYLLQLDKKYSDWLCIQKSIKLTTIKPSGCRPKHGLLTTSSGIYTLEELIENHPMDTKWHFDENINKLDVIQDNSSKNKILKTYRNGKSKLIKIKTNYNYVLESTPNHKWFVKSHKTKSNIHKEINEWIRADELKLNDIIDINLNVYDSNISYIFKDVEKPKSLYESASGHNVIKQPEKMTSDIAWLLGYLWGDGTLSPTCSRIRFIDENTYNLEKIQSILKENFNLSPKIHKCIDRNAYTLECGSVYLWKWLKENEIWKYDVDFYGKKSLSNIPKCVRYSKRTHILAFISGLIDSDGCVSVDKENKELKLQITTSYKNFAKHLQHVCFSVGIVIGRSNNIKGSNHQCKNKQKSIWLMQINGNTLKDSLNVLLKNSNKMKNKQSENLDFTWACLKQSKNKLIVGKITSLKETDYSVETFDVEIENEPWYYAGAAKSHNTTSLLMNATPGLHYPMSEYYIRRIRIEKTQTQLIEATKKAGYKYENSAYGDNSVVFEIPVKEENFYKGKKDASVWEQMQLGSKLQYYWSSNSISQTIHFSKEEEKDLHSVLEFYEDQIKTVSFLPLDCSAYPQMPYETITKEEYEERIKYVKPIDFNFKGNTKDNEEKYCNGDTCTL